MFLKTFRNQVSKQDEKESKEELIEFVEVIILDKAIVKYLIMIGTELTDIDENGNIADKKYSEV